MADATPIFNDAASMFGLDPILPQAVARVESGGLADPDRAVSSAGALGRMQIMPPNLQRMNVRDPTDPQQNIYAGTSMLDEALTAANGNVPLALRIYQGGPDQSKWGPQNAAYPARVGAAYAQIVHERAQAGAQSQPAAQPAQLAASRVQPDDLDSFLSGAAHPPAAGPAAQPAPPSAAPAAPPAPPARDQTDDFLSGVVPSGTASPPAPVSASPAPTGAAPPPGTTVLPVVGLQQPGQSASPTSTQPSGAAPQPVAPPSPASGAATAPALPAAPPNPLIGTANLPPNPLSPAPPPEQPPGFLQNLGAGLYHGGQKVANTLNAGAAYVDSKVPALASLDALFGQNPQTAVDAQTAAEPDYQARYGNSLAARFGDFAGQAAASTPFLMVGGGALGAAGRVAATQFPEVAAALSRAANANLLARGAVGLGRNGLAGATAAELGGDDPLTGAIAGSVAGPVIKYVAAPAATRAVGAIRNLLTGDAERALPVGAIGSPSPPANLLAGARPPENALLQPPGRAPFDIQLNPAGEAAPAVGPNAPTTATEAAAVPSALPGQFRPLVTQADYGKRADAILQHFAAGGRQDVAASAIPGSPKTLAQSTGNAGIATLERSLRGIAPNEFAAVDDGAKQVQQNLLGRITGTNGDYENAVAARDASTAGLRDAAFANTSPVDVQPYLNQVDQAIAQNAGRPSVQGPLQTYRAQLEKIATPDGNGAAMADPRNLDNARLFLGDMVSPLARGTANDGQAASAQLLSLRPALHDLIESGAPGFKNYIQAYADQSGPINGMQYLQTRNLTDLQGNPQLGAIDKTLKDIAQTRTFGRGAQNANGVTPDQVEALGALRDDLLQTKNSLRGKVLGSDTASNLATNSTVSLLANPLAKGAARVGGAVAGTLTGDYGGSMAGYAAGEGVNAALASGQARAEAGVRAALIERLLNRGGRGEAALSASPANASPVAPNALVGTPRPVRVEPTF